ncbi:hypothetical protein M3Y97_00351000 [Aphelenchoides bicaudatus]|nr:hypothetical protein M3Y97_00351000 [Aphelenchoides bicaudatus]
MANILKLSTRQADLLADEIGQNGQSSESAPESMLPKDLPKKSTDQAPESKFVPVPHEIVSENDRRITVDGLVNQRRALGGTGHAEHFINELYAASQINRGPAGFSPSSRLHFDMLVGRDDRIDFSDYLNFSRHQI